MREKRDESSYWVVVVCGNCKCVEEVGIPLGELVGGALRKVKCGGCECAYGDSGLTVWATRVGRGKG